VLAFDPERFAARRQNMHLRRGEEYTGCKSSRGLDDVFAIVEDQKHPLVAQMRDQARRRIV
jgi:hypothetical protein